MLSYILSGRLEFPLSVITVGHEFMFVGSMTVMGSFEAWYKNIFIFTNDTNYVMIR